MSFVSMLLVYMLKPKKLTLYLCCGFIYSFICVSFSTTLGVASRVFLSSYLLCISITIYLILVTVQLSSPFLNCLCTFNCYIYTFLLCSFVSLFFIENCMLFCVYLLMLMFMVLQLPFYISISLKYLHLIIVTSFVSYVV